MCWFLEYPWNILNPPCSETQSILSLKVSCVLRFRISCSLCDESQSKLKVPWIHHVWSLRVSWVHHVLFQSILCPLCDMSKIFLKYLESTFCWVLEYPRSILSRLSFVHHMLSLNILSPSMWRVSSQIILSSPCAKSQSIYRVSCPLGSGVQCILGLSWIHCVLILRIFPKYPNASCAEFQRILRVLWVQCTESQRIPWISWDNSVLCLVVSPHAESGSILWVSNFIVCRVLENPKISEITMSWVSEYSESNMCCVSEYSESTGTEYPKSTNYLVSD